MCGIGAGPGPGPGPGMVGMPCIWTQRGRAFNGMTQRDQRT